jgi:hypothetical protein
VLLDIHLLILQTGLRNYNSAVRIQNGGLHRLFMVGSANSSQFASKRRFQVGTSQDPNFTAIAIQSVNNQP